MTKQDTIIATESRFALASLMLSPLNPRQDVPQEEVIELADSIWNAGLIQSIAGMQTAEGGVEIVAGGRRLRALNYLAEKHPDIATTHPELANPLVMLAPDAETAEVWANAENISRKDLAPVDEIRAYGKMEKAGAPVSGIARAFAVTEAHVRKRLALSNLPEPVLDALGAKEISLGEAACFTIGTDNDLILSVLEEARKGYLSEYQIRARLKPNTVSATDRRANFVGLDAYKEAGGTVTADLFQEKTMLDDAGVLDVLFQEKLTNTARAMRQEAGWKWAETVEDSYVGYHDIEQMKCDRIYAEKGVLSEDDADRYDELAELANSDVLDEAGQAELEALQTIADGVFSDLQKDHAGIIVYVENNGDVRVIEGLVKPEDKVGAVEAGVLTASKHTGTAGKSEKPRISQALQDDLSRVVTGARQHAAINKPDLIMALLAFQLSGGTGYGKAIGVAETEVPNWPTTEATGYALDERLTTPTEWQGDRFDRDLPKAFRAFRKQGEDHIQTELIRHLAGLLIGGDKALKALIDKEAKTDIRAVWTPNTENFFGRVSGSYLNDIWHEVLGLKPGHPTITTFEKLKVGTKREKLDALFNDPEVREAMKLSKAAKTRIAKWLPEGVA
ncbi:MAG: ParB/RepB/Spo0J family partition protein [Pseudomonadota bacterium]